MTSGAYRPHHEHVKPPGRGSVSARLRRCGNQQLRGPLVHEDRQANLRDDLPHGPGSLAHAIAEFHPQIRPQNRQQHSRHTPAGADVENVRAGLEMRGDGHGIGHVTGDEFLHIAMTGEVQPLIPRPKARSIRGEPLDGIGWHGHPKSLAFGGDRGGKLGSGRFLIGHLMNSISR